MLVLLFEDSLVEGCVVNDASVLICVAMLAAKDVIAAALKAEETDLLSALPAPLAIFLNGSHGSIPVLVFALSSAFSRRWLLGCSGHRIRLASSP